MPRPPYDGDLSAQHAQQQLRRTAEQANRQRTSQGVKVPGKRDRYAIGATMDQDVAGVYPVGATGGGSLSTAVVHPDYDPTRSRIEIHLPGTYLFVANLASANTHLNANVTFSMGGGDMDVSALLDHGQTIVGGSVTGVRFETVNSTCQGLCRLTEMDDYVDLSVDGQWTATGGEPDPTLSGSLTIVKVA